MRRLCLPDWKGTRYSISVRGSLYYIISVCLVPRVRVGCQMLHRVVGACCMEWSGRVVRRRVWRVGGRVQGFQGMGWGSWFEVEGVGVGEVFVRDMGRGVWGEGVGGQCGRG